MKTFFKYLLTGIFILIAIAAVLLKYWDYVINPWTRDGQVRAQVIQITSRISGPIVHLAIQDNQKVNKGDLLFEIDPRTFQDDVDQAQAELKQAWIHLAEANDQVKRFKKLSKTVVRESLVVEKINTQKALAAAVDVAKAELHSAHLNLTFSKVYAPVDGYVTNLNLQLGSQAVANQPVLALVDSNSFWIDGFFKETDLEYMQSGDKAIVTLMSYPDKPIDAKVDSIGWGIAQSDGSTGYNLLPTVSPTFEWIRLAQRIPVRVHLDKVPEGVDLRVGSTASVLVMTKK